MKLNVSVGYAVGILLRIAAAGPGASLTAARIARGCKFPPRYLYRVLRRLVDAGLLVGVSGPGGGYRLTRPPRRVRLLDVVDAVDGLPSDEPLAPVERRQRAAFEKINRLNRQARQAFRKRLAGVRLDQLAGK